MELIRYAILQYDERNDFIMSDLNSINLKEIVTEATADIFSVMLSMDLEVTDDDLPESNEQNKESSIVGSIDFTGNVMGSFKIHFTNDFAYLVTSTMLGMEIDDLDMEEDVYDVVGEISNMIGGNLKTFLSNNGFPCNMTVPSIVSGTDFRTEVMNYSRREMYQFKYENNVIQVKIFIKSS